MGAEICNDSLLNAPARPAGNGRRFMGILLTVLNCVIQVSNTEVLRGAKDDRQPYFTVFINHSFTGLTSVLYCALATRVLGVGPSQALQAVGFPSLKAAIKAAALMAVLFKYNVLWSWAIASGTSATIFYAISTPGTNVLTFFLSLCILREPATGRKALAVVLSVLGVVFVTSASGGHAASTLGLALTLGFTVLNALFGVLWGRPPASSEGNSAGGPTDSGRQKLRGDFSSVGKQNAAAGRDMLCALRTSRACGLGGECGIGGSAAWSPHGFEIAPARYLQDCEVSGVLFFIAWVGLATLALCWPPLVILQLLGFQTYAWPSSEEFATMALVACLASLDNATCLVATALTSPLLVAVGRVLTIPLAALLDWFATGLAPSLSQWGGMGCCVLGFLLLAKP